MTPIPPSALWVINDDPETGRALEVALAHDTDKRVCFLASDGKRSTARLIAAAPDLLDALKGLLDFIEIDKLPMNPDALQIARAAVAKAEKAA